MELAKEETAKQQLPVIQHQLPLQLPFCTASNYTGLILARRMLQLQKNPVMASESSRKDYRTSEVKTILVIFSSNPLDRWVKAMQKGYGKRPKIQLVDSRVGQVPGPTLVLFTAAFFFFNCINLSQRKFHETLVLWCVLPKKCLKNAWPITFRD